MNYRIDESLSIPVLAVLICIINTRWKGERSFARTPAPKSLHDSYLIKEDYKIIKSNLEDSSESAEARLLVP